MAGICISGNRARAVASILTATLSAVGLLAACGIPAPSAPATPAPAAVPVPPSAADGDFAGLVDIGGRKLFLECHGSGSPTVVLQSGFGNAADIWSVGPERPPAVAQGTAEFTRVCAYDRPGSMRVSTDDGRPADQPLPGRSDPAPMPRTAADVAGELHTLLATAGVPGPYLLVGHSLGGPFVLLYARTYPSEVAGLVLVDATPPPLRDLLAPAQWEQFQRSVSQPTSPIPGYTMEAYDVTASMDQIKAAPQPPRVPAVLLVAENLDPVPSGDPAAQATSAVDRVRADAFSRFAASIPGAQLVTVPGTTHYIHIQRPDTVIAAIRSMIP